MDSRKIHAMLTVLRLGSFSAAVDELNCTQPAITQMMNALEGELGVKVLRRDHRGVALTADGKSLLPFLSDVDKAVSRLRREAARLAPAEKKTIRIGAFSSICNNLLPLYIGEYRRRCPAVSFDLRIDTVHLAQMLKSGEIDLALGVKDACRGCRWKALVEDPFYAVFLRHQAPENRDYASAQDFRGSSFIESSFYHELNETLEIQPEKIISITADDDNTLLQMVLRGLGATAVPRLSLESLTVPQSIVVLPIKPAASRIIGYAISPTAGAAAKDFARFLTACLRKNSQ
ncbi:MAG: LysR family transcriptional regulator [Pyramidobacter sp.]